MMSPSLGLLLCQGFILKHDIGANLAYWEETIRRGLQSSDATVDIIVLPEMFQTGFYPSAHHLAELPGMHTQKWMQMLADTSGAVVTGTYMVKTPKGIVNRMLWVMPGGETKHYDKAHLFSFSDEATYLTAGRENPIWECKGWRIKPAVCYDIRFPVWLRQPTGVPPFDIMIVPASWPTVRSHVWKVLLQARAMENICYVAGVNRIGDDGNGVSHAGGTMWVDYKGNSLCDATGAEGTYFVKADRESLFDFRKKFPALDDADAFEIKAG